MAQYLTRIPIMTKTFWDLIVAVSKLTDHEQAVLLDRLTPPPPIPPSQAPRN